MIDETHAVASAVACLLPANDAQIGLIKTGGTKHIRDLPAVTMTLEWAASSNAAHAMIQRLVERLLRGRGLASNDKLPTALAAIIFDLLKAASYSPVRPCFRPMRSRTFNGRRITQKPVKRALDLLEVDGFVLRHTGHRDSVDHEGTVTRIVPTSALLGLASNFAITPANRDEHFVRHIEPVRIDDAIKLNAGSRWRGREKVRGKALPVDSTDPQVAGISRFTAMQQIVEADFHGFTRAFNLGNHPDHGYRKGGRLYALGGGYQQMKKAERLSIVINGEPVTEVDIGSAHLTIFLAQAGVQFDPQRDLYHIEGIERAVVKAFINLTIALPRIPRRWPDDMIEELMEGDSPIDLRTYPIAYVRDRCFELYPVLRDRASYPINWADLQYIESCVIIDTIEILNQRNVTALPVHDSLIIPLSKADEAVVILKERFKYYVGVYPKIK